MTSRRAIVFPPPFGSWLTDGSVAQGPQGLQGNPGLPGQAGSVIYAGSGPPAATLGQAIDYYVDQAAGVFIGPKGLSWPESGIAFVGGGSGGPGTPGTPGSVIYSGPGAPAASLGGAKDYYLDTAAGVLLGPKGSAWPQTGVSIVGPPGAAGLAGATGAQGAPGIQGVAGAMGATGPSGPLGPQGPIGPIGPSGADGAAGATGATGATGPIGPIGPIGPTGDVGPIGPVGPSGSNGTPGAPGATGAQGPLGATGPAGADGAPGVQGPIGPQGLVGATGPQGVAGAKGDQGTQGLQGVAGVAGADGATGPQGLTGATGPKGDQGVAGEQGITGATGAPGSNGNTILTGSGAAAPTGAVGNNGDYYLTGANVLYGPKASGAWPSSGTSLIGPPGSTGPQGTTGAQGAAGNTILTGTSAAAPSSAVGNNGDYYLTSAQVLYGPKAAGAWPSTGTSLIGAQGPQGATGIQGQTGATGAQGTTGAQGAQGTAGTNGNTVLTSNTGLPPNTVGNNGDYSLNPNTGVLYGPKSGGVWPQTSLSLIGPQGQAGTNGNTILNGSGQPGQALGTQGDYYIDNAASRIYGPKNAGGWNTAQYVSLIGPQGPTGPAGATGATGAASTVPGPAGTSIVTGNGPPSNTVGNNGDVYLDAQNSILYGPKSAGAWPSTGQSLIGATGATGATGPAGAQGTTGATGATGATGSTGAAGAAGNTILSGATAAAPANTVGNNGDYYLTSAYVLYGPKASGAWPGSGTSLIGPQGATGTTGATGATGPSGPAGQTTLGSNAISNGPLAAAVDTYTTTPKALAAVPGGTYPSVFVPQGPSALMGLYLVYNGGVLSYSLVDVTAGTTIFTLPTVGGSNLQGPFGTTQFPLVQGHVHQWQAVSQSGSVAATNLLWPYYLEPSAAPSAAVGYAGSASTANSKAMNSQFNLSVCGTNGGILYATAPMKAASLYGLTCTYTPASGTPASATVPVYVQSVTTSTVVYNATVTATGTPQNFGPFSVGQYPLAAGTQYLVQVRTGSGTGYLQVDLYWII